MKNLQKSFAQYLQVIGYSSSTQNAMLYAVEEFCNYVVKGFNKITKEDIKTYAKYLSTRPNRRRSGGLSSSIIRHYLYGLKVFFSWCEQTGRLHKNPMSGYPLPQVERVKRVILSRTEIGRLYEVCEHYEEEALVGDLLWMWT